MRRTRARSQSGFTLIEVMIAVAVLGVLSGVTVFSVSAVQDHAQRSACAADAKVIDTAESTAWSTGGAYLSEEALVAAGRLRTESSLHDVVVADGTYSLVPVGDCAVDGGEVAGGDAGLGEEVAAEEPALTDEEAKKAEEARAAEEAAKAEEAKKAEEAARAAEEAKKAEEATPSGCRSGQIDINSASKRDLRRIDHVGGDEATRIEKQRPFKSVEQLVEVKGIEDDDIKDILEQGLACVA